MSARPTLSSSRKPRLPKVGSSAPDRRAQGDPTCRHRPPRASPASPSWPPSRSVPALLAPARRRPARPPRPPPRPPAQRRPRPGPDRRHRRRSRPLSPRRTRMRPTTPGMPRPRSPSPCATAEPPPASRRHGRAATTVTITDGGHVPRHRHPLGRPARRRHGDDGIVRLVLDGVSITSPAGRAQRGRRREGGRDPRRRHRPTPWPTPPPTSSRAPTSPSRTPPCSARPT